MLTVKRFGKHYGEKRGRNGTQNKGFQKSIIHKMRGVTRGWNGENYAREALGGEGTVREGEGRG